MTTPAATDPPRSETADRYLETIYYIQHEGEVARPGRLAEWLGVSAPTVTVSLQRLARAGWLTILADRSVELTDVGAVAASEIVRRHRIVERWLTDVLDCDWATADSEAAALAHGMSDLVLSRLDALLGKPSTCPHGNVIPGRRAPAGRPLRRLNELGDGVAAPIARISEVAEHTAPQLLGELDAQGLTPGTDVRILVRHDDGFELGAHGRTFTMRADVVRAIWVEAPV